MFISLISLSSAYFISGNFSKDYDQDKGKIEDIFLTLVFMGFIGARITYFLFNIEAYKGNLLSIFSLSHGNLSLVGGIIFGIGTLIFLSRKNLISLEVLLNIFLPIFYLSMSIGVWYFKFEEYALNLNFIRNSSIKVLVMSIAYLFFMIYQLFFSKKLDNKYIDMLILILTLIIFYKI